MHGADVVIDSAGLPPGTPEFHTYRYRGKNINYFVLKIQGKVSAFLDACASCYPHKRGYRRDNGSVICRACGIRIPVTRLEKGIGNCCPIKIEGKQENGKYLIPVSALEAARDKF
jgi:uncharacterized membrane protein